VGASEAANLASTIVITRRVARLIFLVNIVNLIITRSYGLYHRHQSLIPLVSQEYYRV
jgi:hypothetical protein